MKQLSNNVIGDVWLEYIEAVSQNGKLVFDSHEDVYECPPISFYIDRFSDDKGILARNADHHVIEIYTKKMFSMEIIDELNSTYGDRFFNNLGIDQFQLASEKLLENPWAKSCFIPLVIPNDPGPRIPCLSAIQVALRENSVTIYATFRSQNAFRAYGNFFGLRAIQKRFSEKLKRPCGRIYFFVNFPHIYKSDFDRAVEIVNNEKKLCKSNRILNSVL